MYTIFGATGFIGSNLARHLRSLGEKVLTPARGEDTSGKALGHAVYCIGLTADFRKRPFDTMDAHVSVLAPLLRADNFDSFLYLSSTRIYLKATSGAETADLPVSPNDPEDIFALSKLAGEAICLAHPAPTVRAARVSNVVGPDFRSENFLTSVIADAVRKRVVTLRTTEDSAKDYVLLEDALKMLVAVAQKGKERVYNVASGSNTTNKIVLQEVQRLTGCEVHWSPDALKVVFPAIDTRRIQAIASAQPSPVLPAIGPLIEAFRRSAA